MERVRINATSTLDTMPPCPRRSWLAAGGVGVTAQERMAKAVKLLACLPPETPLPVKKQIVEASLQVFDVSIPAIVETGAAQVAALDAFLGVGRATTQRIVADAATCIAKLEAQIVEVRALAEARVRDHQGQMETCTLKQQEVLRVLEFFGVRDQVPSVPTIQDPPSEA